MERLFSAFILQKWERTKSLLLALSGGPDSLALFYLLLKQKVPFAVAHVNHRWRPESDQEALTLNVLCKKNGISFHEKVLSLHEEGNKEEVCRRQRYAFFHELCKEFDFQAVILGHHADDQAETILKRVFEGAVLYHMSGMGCETKQQELLLWRPLLHVSKKEIKEWLEKQHIQPFEDTTNGDDRFLRGRMRTTLFPLLSKNFGKEIVPSLTRIGHQAMELKEFLEVSLSHYRKCYKENMLDLSNQTIETGFEWKWIVRDFFEKNGMVLSSLALDSIVKHLIEGRGRKEMRLKDKCVFISKCRIEIYPNNSSK